MGPARADRNSLYAIRSAWETLAQLRGSVEWDASGEFSELANMKEFWPRFGCTLPSNSSVSLPPWPTDSQAERLLWLAHRGARFICLTVAEQDDLYPEAYREGIDQMQQRAWVAEGFRAIGSSRGSSAPATGDPVDVPA
jgi:hypothetical protein